MPVLTKAALRRSVPVAMLPVVLVACVSAGPPPSPTPTLSADAITTDGLFRLELALPRTGWIAGEPITGRVVLSYDGATPTTVYGSSMLLNFRYAEVSGQHKVDPASPADCATHRLDRATPITSQLSKSGGYSDAMPDATFLRSFLTGGDVRLPAGTWDISTFAVFTQAQACGGPMRTMTTTVRIVVAP
jgi:hypothetical protein